MTSGLMTVLLLSYLHCLRQGQTGMGHTITGESPEMLTWLELPLTRMPVQVVTLGWDFKGRGSKSGKGGSCTAPVHDCCARPGTQYRSQLTVAPIEEQGAGHVAANPHHARVEGCWGMLGAIHTLQFLAGPEPQLSCLGGAKESLQAMMALSHHSVRPACPGWRAADTGRAPSVSTAETA